MAPAPFLSDAQERMARTIYARDVIAVRRSRARLARIFARIALGAVVGPVALALIASGLSAIGFPTLSNISLEAWLLGWLVGTPIATIAALVAGADHRQRAARVEVDDDALRLVAKRKARIIPRQRLTGAFAYLDGSLRHADVVEIALANGDVLHVELATSEAAQDLVTALGFGASERRTVVPLGEAHESLAAGCWGVVAAVIASTLSTCGILGISAHLLNDAAGYLIGAVFVGSSLLFARLFSPKRVVVGNDGLLVEGSFRDRFISLASITRAEVTDRGLVLAVDDGGAARTVVLTSSRTNRSFALRERIVQAMAAGRAGAETTSALVARGGRSLVEWREALRKLVGSSGGYRGESVSIDALLRAVESADTPAEQRLGAAMAVGLAEDAAAKQRLRIAVEGIANERMREAMEAAAEGEAVDEMIEAALAAEKKAIERR